MRQKQQFLIEDRNNYNNNMFLLVVLICCELHLTWSESDSAALLVVFPYKYPGGKQYVVDPIKEFKDFSGQPKHTEAYLPVPPEAYSTEEPTCATNVNASLHGLCLMDYEYPTYAVEKALLIHYEAIIDLYKDVLVSANNSANYLTKNGTEKYLCPSNVTYAKPLRAKNVRGKWRIIVNDVRVHYDTLSQSVRLESCFGENKCPLTAEDATNESKCVQKDSYQRLLVYDPHDYALPFTMDTFKLPTSCACFAPFVANPEDEDDDGSLVFGQPQALNRPQGLAFVTGEAAPVGLGVALASDPTGGVMALFRGEKPEEPETNNRLTSDYSDAVNFPDASRSSGNGIEATFESAEFESEEEEEDFLDEDEDVESFEISRRDDDEEETDYEDFSPAEFDEALALAAVLTAADYDLQ